MTFPESRLAHQLLDGLHGIEIGGSAHNPFGLYTWNVAYGKNSQIFKLEETQMCGSNMPVHVDARGDELPFADNSQDFVVSSHVLEHFNDPIRAILEWHRVVRPGGFVFMVVPHKDRTFDSSRERTTLTELVDRHEANLTDDGNREHMSVWIAADVTALVLYLGFSVHTLQDPDDKVGNGFTVVIRKDEARQD
jgi:SAM-dependent methyltransferase